MDSNFNKPSMMLRDVRFDILIWNKMPTTLNSEPIQNIEY